MRLNFNQWQPLSKEEANKAYTTLLQNYIQKYQPTNMRIIGTYRCNLRCPHCYQAHYDSVDMTPANLANTLQLLSQAGFRPDRVTIQGGEFTVIPYYTALLHEINQAYPTVTKALTTNGNLYVHEYRAMWRQGISHISFTMNKYDVDYMVDILEVGESPALNVRVNSFFSNIDTACRLINECRSERVPLTFCEDIRQAPEDSLATQRTLEGALLRWRMTEINPYMTKFSDEEWDYEFMLFKYAPEGYSTLYILPDGSVTCDNREVMACEGNGLTTTQTT